MAWLDGAVFVVPSDGRDELGLVRGERRVRAVGGALLDLVQDGEGVVQPGGASARLRTRRVRPPGSARLFCSAHGLKSLGFTSTPCVLVRETLT
jgi:hypothetical protein